MKVEVVKGKLGKLCINNSRYKLKNFQGYDKDGI